MSEKIHKPVQVGSVGGRDAWGYGSSTKYYSWPTLGVERKIVNGSCGGINHPRIQGVDPVYDGTEGIAGPLSWKSGNPRWELPDGRIIVAGDGYDLIEV